MNCYRDAPIELRDPFPKELLVPRVLWTNGTYRIVYTGLRRGTAKRGHYHVQTFAFEKQGGRDAMGRRLWMPETIQYDLLVSWAMPLLPEGTAYEVDDAIQEPAP